MDFQSPIDRTQTLQPRLTSPPLGASAEMKATHLAGGLVSGYSAAAFSILCSRPLPSPACCGLLFISLRRRRMTQDFAASKKVHE